MLFSGVEIKTSVLLSFCFLSFILGTNVVGVQVESKLLLDMSSHDELLRSKLEKLGAESAKEMGQGIKSIGWRNRAIEVKNEKTRACIAAGRALMAELHAARDAPWQPTSESNDDTFQRCFAQLDDALRHIREDIKKLGAAKLKGVGDEPLHELEKYCNYNKMELTVTRGDMILKSLLARWKSQDSSSGKRFYRPKFPFSS